VHAIEPIGEPKDGHNMAAMNEFPFPKSLVATAYRQLRSDIVAGKLKPGSRLRVEHLKERYKVGAGTLREALSLLVADLLVVSQDQRGFRVAPISLADFRDITETRAMLEAEALRQSIRNANDEWEGELVSAFHLLRLAEERTERSDSQTLIDYEVSNRRFHTALLRNCPSHWTKHFVSVLYRQSERYRRLSLANPPPKRDVHAEHATIFEAALAHDSEAAAAALADHITQTYRVISALTDSMNFEGVETTASYTGS